MIVEAGHYYGRTIKGKVVLDGKKLEESGIPGYGDCYLLDVTDFSDFYYSWDKDEWLNPHKEGYKFFRDFLKNNRRYFWANKESVSVCNYRIMETE